VEAQVEDEEERKPEEGCDSVGRASRRSKPTHSEKVGVSLCLLERREK